MGRLWFFIQEALRALKRNAAPTIAAIVTTIVTVVLLGVLIPALFFTQSTSQGVREELAVKAFLYDDATKAEVAALKARIGGLPHVRSVQFVSKRQALNILQSRLNDKNILKELNTNPLPASFTVKPDDASNLTLVRQELAPTDPSGNSKPISGIIEKVNDNRDVSNPIEKVTSALKIILGVITALLIVASVMLVGNTIRLSIYARRREVEVMRLVGATRWFVRWPFMIEGVVVGFTGGLVAILILWLGKVTIVDPLSNSFALVAAQTNSSIAFPALVAVLFVSAIVVSAIGSGVTLRRFLRV